MTLSFPVFSRLHLDYCTSNSSYRAPRTAESLYEERSYSVNHWSRSTLERRLPSDSYTLAVSTRHRRTVMSSEADAMSAELLEKTSARTLPRCPSSVFIQAPELPCQIRIGRSPTQVSPADARRAESCEKAIESTRRRYPSRVFMQSPVLVNQILIVPSASPVAIRVESCENAIDKGQKPS